MKKLGLFCLAALLLAAALAVWCGGAKTAAPLEPLEGRDFMRAQLTGDEGLRTLRGRQTLTAANTTGADLDTIVLRLPMNAQPGSSCAVSAVTVDGKDAAFSLDADDQTVLTIRHPWPAEKRVEIAWTVMVKCAASQGAMLVTLPSLAMPEGGAWRTDAYDGLADVGYAGAFDFCIEVDGGVAAQQRMARDASFAWLPGGSVREKEVSGVRIRAVAQDGRAAARLLAGTKDALASLNDAGFAYPYDVLTVADSRAAKLDGTALSGLIALDAGKDGEPLRRMLTRLMARQIFGVYVENDPWNAPWLSHSLAASAELLAYRKLRGAAAYEERFYGEIELALRLTRPAGVTVGASTAHFGSESEMTQVLRDQGAAMLLGIEQAVGEETFVTALNLYIESCGGGVGSLKALCSALERAGAGRWDGYLEDGLSF